MAVLNIAPRTAALTAAMALLAPGTVLAQATDSSMRNSLTTDQLNQQMLMMLEDDPSALMPADQAMTGQGGAAAMPGYAGDVQIFEDAEGNRYVRADSYDRMMMARGGTTGSYQSYVDDRGIRYYQLGPNDQPMMGATTGGGALSRTLEDPSLRTSPEYEDEAEVFEDSAGNRYMRVGVDNRIVGAPAGSPMASMDVSGYPIYQDAQGYRYIRVDANNQPMMTTAAD